jgi:hypothetical protein
MVNELEYRFYAYHIYYFSFKDYSTLQNVVFQNVPSSSEIYNDATFGMSSPSTLYFWVQAYFQGQSSIFYKAIIDHFNSNSIPLTDANMD